MNKPWFFYAPYIPMKDTNWQAYLRKLQADYASWTKLGQYCEGDGLADANDMMQERFPGPYRVIDYWDSQRDQFSLRLEFDDPREQTMWLLRWC